LREVSYPVTILPKFYPYPTSTSCFKNCLEFSQQYAIARVKQSPDVHMGNHQATATDLFYKDLVVLWVRKAGGFIATSSNATIYYPL
jgi:hypothetical protein